MEEQADCTVTVIIITIIPSSPQWGTGHKWLKKLTNKRKSKQSIHANLKIIVHQVCCVQRYFMCKGCSHIEENLFNDVTFSDL